MALSYPRRRLSTTAREALYDRCRGDNEFPTCNICGLPVEGFREAWDESHHPDGAPHALNGNNDDVGVAHRECNRRHGAEVVIPLIAKVKRIRQKGIGAFRSRSPMACGRDSNRMKKMDGSVVARPTRVQKLALPSKFRSFDQLDVELDAVAAEMAVRQ